MTSSCLDEREDTLAETLERFNRKERNLLVRDVLGHNEKPLMLREGFLEEVAKALKIPKLKPENAHWWTDYHYAWLAGALAVYFEGEEALEIARPNRQKDPSGLAKSRYLVEGNSEDADLVIASGSDLILVEVKAYGAWSNKQMASKRARLQLLQDELTALSEKSPPQKTVRLHLLLMSPSEPEKLDLQGSPIPHVKLRLASSGLSILDVSRCDKEGHKMITTSYWRVGRIKKRFLEPKDQ